MKKFPVRENIKQQRQKIPGIPKFIHLLIQQMFVVITEQEETEVRPEGKQRHIKQKLRLKKYRL